MHTFIFFVLACTDSVDDRSPNTDTTDYPDLAAVDAVILDEMAAGHVPGLAACGLASGEVTWCQGYGWADLDAREPVDPSTPFLLASMSKTVVGSAALIAAQEGLLDLDAPVVVGFDVHHPDSPGTAITPRMLASHTSGIADNWDVMDESYSDGDSPIALGEFLESYLVPGGSRHSSDSWGRAPATDLDYSNVAVALLAYAVEVAAGVPFQDFCRTRIFEPLGMADTAWHLADLEAEPAMPYTWAQGSYKAEGHYGFPDYPSGQLRAGAEPMARYLADAMAHGPDALFEAQAPGLEPDQGFVWYRWNQDGETLWGHNGGEVGVSTELGFTADGRGFVVAMNGEGRANTLANIEAAILGAL